MTNSIYEIPVLNLVFALTLIVFVGIIYFRWSKRDTTILYATARMIGQLLLIGLLLNFIFSYKNKIIITLILLVMMLTASWIALRPIKEKRLKFYLRTLLSIVLGSLPVLLFIVFFVIELEPWFEPRYLIPIAGMIFAYAMNSVSLAAERYDKEIAIGDSYYEARGIAFRTSLLPLLNSFFAVGIVSLPGMMTGQILAGISPLIAVRYQIMVMAMLLASGGFSAAIYLTFAKQDINKN